MEKRMHVRLELETDPMTNETERTYNDEDPFRLLPEEIIIAIFNKVTDLKCLFQCSLVSKHFASVIPHVQTVSLDVLESGPCTDESFENMNTLAGELHNCSSEEIHSLLDSLSLQNLKLPNFLQKFRALKSISLDYKYPEQSANIPFPTRKVKFCSNSVTLERFVGISPLYVHKDDENVTDEEQYTGNYKAACSRIVECAWQFLDRYMEWMCRILVLAKFHTSLQSMTITDSEMNGKLVLGHEQFSNNRELFGEMVNSVTSCNLTIAWVPVLHLPSSGYVLRGATVVIINVPEDPLLSSKNVEEITNKDYEGKLMVLREAVTEIIKNRADKIRPGRMRDIEDF